MKAPAIYCIRNTVNNKVYIGSTNDFYTRIQSHLLTLRKGIHGSDHLQKAWNKYGEQNFEWYPIVCVLDISKIIEIEQYFLDLFRAYDDRFEYNIRKIADSNTGIKRTKEQCIQLSLQRRGRKRKTPFSDEAKKKISIANTGERNGMFGRKLTKQERRVRSVNMQNYCKKRYPYKPFLCCETGDKFDYPIEAGKKYQIRSDNVLNCLKGIRKSCGGYTFRYL